MSFFNNEASMRGSTNRSSCEATVASPSTLAAMSFIVIHRILMNKKKKRKRSLWWVKRLFKNGLKYGNRLLEDMTFESNEDTVKNFTRMSVTEFEYLASLISSKVEKSNTYMRQVITVKERLAITLRFLATGDSFKSLQYLFRVSKQSISTIFPEVCGAIIDARAAVQPERATRSEAHLSTSKNRLALARRAAAFIPGKRRGEAGIHFASLAARGVLAMCVHGLMCIQAIIR
jgi:hypothetical protein